MSNEYSEDSPAKWMTESDKEALMRAGIKYMDITDFPNPEVMSLTDWQPGKKKKAHVIIVISHDCFIVIPNKVKYQDEVSPFIGNLTTDTMKEVLTELTSFRNRYYKSSWGAKSCRWLIEQIRDVADGFDHVSVKEFEHSVCNHQKKINR